jgi:hypothetical protein
VIDFPARPPAVGAACTDQILEGRHDELGEDALIMVGSLDAALEKAERLRAGSSISRASRS